MSRGAGDLIPVFLAEARERLEILKERAGAAGEAPEALEEIRRQLHGLKGASRMLGLDELASLCHRGEDLLAGAGAVDREALLEVLRGIEAKTDELEAARPGAGKAAPERKPGVRPARPGASGVVRGGVIGVAARVLDETTARATRLRHLTAAEAGEIEELFELSRFAETGVTEREPGQVLATLAISLRQVAMDLDRTHRTVLELLRQSQEELVRLHRQPVKPYLERLGRHAGELAGALGKQVTVTVQCGRVTLDRRLMGDLEEPLLHLVRNALDHGLESPAERRASGKPPAGALELGARGEGEMVIIWVRDDGRGLDPERIAARARELGLLPEDAKGPQREAELFNLVFRPDFSTAAEVTEISGRGVGLDAVAAVVHRLGGRVELQSEFGKGTTIRLCVPAVRRGENILVVAAGGRHAAVGAVHVLHYVELSRCRLSSEGDTETAFIEEERPVRIHRLARLFGEPAAHREGFLVVLSSGESEVGLVVERLEGEEEVVLQPFPKIAGSHPVFESVTLLSSGLPVPVLSPRLLAVLRPGEIPSLAEDGRSRRLRVLVVDDSRVTRGMLRRVLEDAGCSVVAVASGEQALRWLRARSWDCLVTDVEMPGMDGLELTRRLRSTKELRHLPIVVVSTRGSPEDRVAGLEAGADAYLTKQSMTSRELVRTVRRFGGVP